MINQMLPTNYFQNANNNQDQQDDPEMEEALAMLQKIRQKEAQ